LCEHHARHQVASGAEYEVAVFQVREWNLYGALHTQDVLAIGRPMCNVAQGASRQRDGQRDTGEPICPP
jgi:hypothetical protein